MKEEEKDEKRDTNYLFFSWSVVDDILYVCQNAIGSRAFSGSRNYLSVNDPRSVRRGRVTPRTYFLSNSLFRGRVLSAHRLSAFSHCILPPFLSLDSLLPSSVSSSSSSFSIFPLPFSLNLSVVAAVIAAIAVVAVVRSLFLFPAKPLRAHVPRNRTAFSSDIWRCTIKSLVSSLIGDRRSVIPIVKSAKTLFLARHDGSASLFSHCMEKCYLRFLIWAKNLQRCTQNVFCLLQKVRNK